MEEEHAARALMVTNAFVTKDIPTTASIRKHAQVINNNTLVLPFPSLPSSAPPSVSSQLSGN